MKNQFNFDVSNVMKWIRRKHRVSMAQEHLLMIADDGEAQFISAI